MKATGLFATYVAGVYTWPLRAENPIAAGTRNVRIAPAVTPISRPRTSAGRVAGRIIGKRPSPSVPGSPPEPALPPEPTPVAVPDPVLPALPVACVLPPALDAPSPTSLEQALAS